MARNVIVVGDPTSSGGTVITGTPFTDIDGHPVARISDQATCLKHQGTFPIVTGDYTVIIDGHPVARHGDKLACGCSLLSARQFRVFLDEGGFGGAAKTVLAAPPIMALAKTPMAPAAFSDTSAGTLEQAGQAEQTPATVTLRIGVFFDGTNNNAANTALGEQCRASTGEALGQDVEDQTAIAAHCKPYMTRDGSSYDNGVTNVARLYGLYQDSNAQSPDATGRYALRVYVDGIGTSAGAPDSLLTQGLGGGRSGVLSRVEETFRSLMPDQLRRFSEKFGHMQVGKVEFDIFGFSRGAAAARHFVHEVNRKGHGPLGHALLNRGIRYASGFEFATGVQVGFVGLFDSVAAIGSLADGLDVRDTRQGGVRMALPAGSAREVVHLTARDERRANFLLTSVSPPYHDIVLPGVHSDIGGGYHHDREGPLLLSKPVGFDESHASLLPGQTPDQALIERSRAHVLAMAEAVRWREQLGLSETEVRVDAWHLWQTRRRAGSPSVQPDRVLRIYAAVVLERALDWRYQLVPLRLMHKRASEVGVPMKPIPDEPVFMPPTELEPIADKLITGKSLNESEEALLRRKYLHQSAHWNFTLGQKLGPGPVSLDLMYVSRPDPSGRRGMLPNQ